MWDITQISEVTLVGLASVAILGIWVAVAFYRSHRAFKARESLYLSLKERFRKGEMDLPPEFNKLLPEDQKALLALQCTWVTISTPANHDVTSVPPESHPAPVGNRG